MKAKTSIMDKRLDNEIKTARVMITMFCRRLHGGQGMCGDCLGLMNYVEQRLRKCPHGGSKPACSKCKIHCYQLQMRARIKEVMRFSGPRMALAHPVLAFRHWKSTR